MSEYDRLRAQRDAIEDQHRQSDTLFLENAELRKIIERLQSARQDSHLQIALKQVQDQRNEAMMKVNAKWQPIETAPKDGKWIIVYRPVASYSTPHVGADRYLVRKYFGEGWINSGPSTQPTMWQPMPAPPAALLNASQDESAA